MLARLFEDDEQLAPLRSARTSLIAAIAAAETSAGGKAIEADLNDESAAPVFDIEVANAEGVVTAVAIDGVTGVVTSTQPPGGDETDDDGERNN